MIEPSPGAIRSFGTESKSSEPKSNGDIPEVSGSNTGTLGRKSSVSDALILNGPIFGISFVNLSHHNLIQ